MRFFQLNTSLVYTVTHVCIYTAVFCVRNALSTDSQPLDYRERFAYSNGGGFLPLLA